MRFLASRFIGIVLVAFAPLLAAGPASAQSVSIIRDAEVERMVLDFAAPLFKAAGIRSPSRVNIVADRRFNAFVVEDGSIFVNYGTILNVRTPNALKAVLAHEIGHLAGGHLARIREQIEVNGKLQIAAMLLGVGALAASSGGGKTEVGEMASAFIIASQSVGQNSLMAYRRSEESAADAAGLKFLDRSGQSGKGMVDVLKTLAGDELGRAGSSPYLRSHPLAADRLDQVTAAARVGRNWGRDDPARDVVALALAQAKLSGFLEPRASVLNRYPNTDKSLAARYARIIAAYKGGGGISALTQMPSLVAVSSSNPYFQELLGQMYFETGQAAKALPPLRRAVELAPRETEIRVLYGQVLVDAGGEKNLTEALSQLNRVVREDPRSVRGYTLLSRALGGLGRPGEATLAAAGAALARGDKGTALGLAHKAQKELNENSPAWIRAEDIILSLQ